MNDKLNNNVTIIPPFKRFCMTIGELPSSYTESMTYYESLVWLCNYIQNTLIPAINNNGEAVTELQEKYIELKNYVDNYFENLDVQEEINNKLDDMAEHGELSEIIAVYLQMASVLGYDTKSALKGAENVISGSICKTLGDSSYSDGDGHFYKIRDLEEGDVIDDDELVGLTNFPTLVAEKIADYYIDELNDDVSSIESDINTINNTTIPAITAEIEKIKDYKERKYLFVGDSYATGYQGEGEDPIVGFYNRVITDLGLTAQVVAHNGAGFLGLSNINKWEDWLTTDYIPDKDTFTDVFICGGMNDTGDSAILKPAIISCINYVKTNFPNATIHIGCIGRFREGTNAQLERVRKVDRIYKMTATANGCKYIDGSFLLLHHRDWYISDNIHPNSDGENQLAYGIEQYIINGEITDFMDITSSLDFSGDTFTPAEGVTADVYAYSYLNKNVATLYFSGNITFTENVTISNLSDIVIGKLTSSYICSSANNQGIGQIVTGYVYSVNEINSSHVVKVNARLYNDSYNNIHLKFFTVMDNGGLLSDVVINLFSIPYSSDTLSCGSRYC